MRVKTNQKEAGAIAHLLLEKCEELKKAGVRIYGPDTINPTLTLDGLGDLAGRFLSTKTDPLELYFIQNRCPACNVAFRCGADSCYCPECGEEWYPEKVFKKFW